MTKVLLGDILRSIFSRKSLPVRDITENYCKMHIFAVTCRSDQLRFAKDPNVADGIYQLVNLQNLQNSADFCHIPIIFTQGHKLVTIILT
jgi:hypothetical protein